MNGSEKVKEIKERYIRKFEINCTPKDISLVSYGKMLLNERRIEFYSKIQVNNIYVVEKKRIEQKRIEICNYKNEANVNQQLSQKIEKELSVFFPSDSKLYSKHCSIKRLEEKQLRYRLKIYGAEDSIWYGNSIKVDIEIPNDFLLNGNFRAKCLDSHFYHPLIDRNGQIGIGNDVSHKTVFASQDSVYNSIVRLLSFIVLAHYVYLEGVEWNEDNFMKTKKRFLIDWKPKINHYYPLQIREKIGTLLRSFLVSKKLKKKQMKEKKEPKNEEKQEQNIYFFKDLIVEIPRGVFMMILKHFVFLEFCKCIETTIC